MSVFEADVLRATPEAAVRRNQFVAATAEILLVPCCVRRECGARAQQAIARGKTVLTFDDKDNFHLLAYGAIPIPADSVVDFGERHTVRAHTFHQFRSDRQ